jgi:predicted glycoside hydrolase/deacetylase ChbG (UPF0249 family)
MLIINADDFGKNHFVTNRILFCFMKKLISSVSAMVFMKDSERASELAKGHGLDVGLHLNLTQSFSQEINNFRLHEMHEQILKFLLKNRYIHLIYNPFLKKQFEYVYQAQLEEFQRLYDFLPSHINGHHHMHLCSNMLFGEIIPEGQKVRRNFTYDRGEKILFNRLYRKYMDEFLRKKYIITDSLFSLPEVIKFKKIEKIIELSKSSVVELETHPEEEADFNWLNKNLPLQTNLKIELGSYTQLDVSLKL